MADFQYRFWIIPFLGWSYGLRLQLQNLFQLIKNFPSLSINYILCQIPRMGDKAELESYGQVTSQSYLTLSKKNHYSSRPWNSMDWSCVGPPMDCFQ